MEWERSRNEARIDRLKRRSKLPARFERYTFENYTPNSEDQERARRICLSYVKRFNDETVSLGKSLYIEGPYGSGKTHLAVAVMQRLINERKVPCLFMTVPEMLEQMRDEYDQQESESVLDTVKNAEFLVLDDLGAEKPTEWSQERLFMIINHRYNNSLPTIFTSNYSLEALGEYRVGGRIESRMHEMCHVVFPGDLDYRKGEK